VSAKHGYRKYKIKNDKKSDDLAAMREVLLRRFKTTDDLPDLFILDGSRTQLGVVGELLNSEWKDASRTEYVQFASL
jgi:excinuclease UvrABC nuclease subunit